MVTFSLPGDNDGHDASQGTPRPRPPLPFAKRAYVSTPYANKRLGTPRSAPARKLLNTRDEIPASSLNRNSISTSRNIFRASTANDSHSVTPFSPSINLPANTPKKVFAPGATPEPSRVYRESMIQATPRGMAAKATSKDLFPMRIEDPDPELSGEALTRKIPKDWNTKGSIYADQFLAHLCPSEFDDEQRRQFFCILDLRRLKYAANEIFAKKDWKLNVINFAKEFEKSRSIILLRYGLYEFQNVKPSKEVLKRWRREHGLPEPEDEAVEPTPSKANASKKRKADDDLKDSAATTSLANKSKRLATERDEDDAEEALAPTPAPPKNKRKASVSDESEAQPFKMQKSTSSAAKSLFEKIANKSTTTPSGSPMKPIVKSVEESTTPKPNPFAAAKPNGGGLARSVFQNLKPGNASAANIFGYLSDASSAKNSGVEADAESSTDSDIEESQEAGQSDEPGASGTETASQVGSTLFGQKTLPPSGLAVDGSSAPGTRESTPGRSLFDRVTKGSDGQPLRSEEKAESPASETPTAPADQTWNPTTTPLKFAPSSTAQASSLFGKSTTSTPAGSIFAPKSTSTASNIFGAPKQDKPAEEKAATPDADEADKTGGESDKENDSQASKKSLFEPKAPAAQPSLGSSLFQPEPAEPAKEVEPAKPVSSLFGAAPKTNDKPAASSTPNIFGAVSKPAEATPAPTTSVMQSSTLFGGKPAGSEPAKAETPKPASLFGASTTTPSAPLFGAKPSGNASSIFGGASSTTSAKPLFGAPSSEDASAAPKTDAPASTASPFTFGAASSSGDKSNGAAPKPIFGVPKSPSSGPNGHSLFSGSPMKQDAPSPAKNAFNGGANGASSATPTFSFGAQSGAAAPSAPIFGNALAAPANGTSTAAPIFGGVAPATSGSGGFSFGASTSGTSFNNPFASGNSRDNSGAAPTSTPGGMFSFGGNNASAAGASPFQFGTGSSTGSAPVFGAGSSAPASKSVFGGASGPSGAPGFNFTAASPQPPQGAGSIFGSSQPAPAFGNLQPPAGGASTTGTSKSPFPNRKIRPLKRRV